MHGHQLCFEDVKPGSALAPLVKRPTTVQLFRFSAMTWNAHRIHFDKPYAMTEGYPDVLVQAHLHGSFLYQAVADWAGPRARVIKFGWQNRGIAIAGDVLTCSGRVAKADAGVVECELEERNQKGDLCASGWARVELPRRS